MPVKYTRGRPAGAHICSWLCACNLSRLPGGAETFVKSSVAILTALTPWLSRPRLNICRRLKKFVMPPAFVIWLISVLSVQTVKAWIRYDTDCRVRSQLSTYGLIICDSDRPANAYAGLRMSGTSRVMIVSRREE